MAMFTSHLARPFTRLPDELSAPQSFDEVYRESVTNLLWRWNPAVKSDEPIYRERLIFSLDLVANGPLADFEHTAKELFTTLGGYLGKLGKLEICSDEYIENHEKRVIAKMYKIGGDNRIEIMGSTLRSERLFSFISPIVKLESFIYRPSEFDRSRLKKLMRTKRPIEVNYHPNAGKELGRAEKIYQGRISKIGDDFLTLKTSEGYRTMNFGRIKRLHILPRKAKISSEPVYRLNMFLTEFDTDSFAVVIAYGYREDPRLSRLKWIDSEYDRNRDNKQATGESS